MMHNQENTAEIRPRSIGRGCAYLIVFAIIGPIEFVEAIPYHVRFYLWCAWHFTGGQLKLRFALWQLSQGQKRIRKSNPYFRECIR